jgi:hypothetical protein
MDTNKQYLKNVITYSVLSSKDLIVNTMLLIIRQCGCRMVTYLDIVAIRAFSILSIGDMIVYLLPSWLIWALSALNRWYVTIVLKDHMFSFYSRIIGDALRYQTIMNDKLASSDAGVDTLSFLIEIHLNIHYEIFHFFACSQLSTIIVVKRPHHANSTSSGQNVQVGCYANQTSFLNSRCQMLVI